VTSTIGELEARLVGSPLPGGRQSVSPAEAWLGDDAMQARHPRTSQLQPIWVFILALRGMGVSIGELLEWAGSRVDDGVLFGELAIDELVPLLVDHEYDVTGAITSIVRKEGQKTGVFDILTFDLEVARDGVVHGRASSSFILPRRP